MDKIHSLAPDPLFKTLKILWYSTHVRYSLNELAHVRETLGSGPIRLVESFPGDVLKAIQEHCYIEWDDDFLAKSPVKGLFFANIHATLTMIKRKKT